MAIGKQPSRAPRGPGAKALRNAMPRRLLDEILDEANRNQRDQPADVVIDLCAGYRSLEPTVRERGLTYIAVEIRKSGAEDVGA